MRRPLDQLPSLFPASKWYESIDFVSDWDRSYLFSHLRFPTQHSHCIWRSLALTGCNCNSASTLSNIYKLLSTQSSSLKKLIKEIDSRILLLISRFKRVQNCESHLNFYSVPSRIIKKCTLKIKSDQRVDYVRRMWYNKIIKICDQRWRKILWKKHKF